VGFSGGARPFGVVEFIWAGIALRRYLMAGIADGVDTNSS